MTTESRSMEELKRAQALDGILESAIEAAASYDYDAPSERAIERARELLANIAHAFDDTEPFDVAVGIDGSIEITASGAVSSITIDVSPTGSRVDAVAGNYETGEVTWVGRDPAWPTLVKEIERAA